MFSIFHYYNIQDVEIVDKLEDSDGSIDLAYYAYEGKANYSMFLIKYWDILIYNFEKEDCYTTKSHNKNEQYEGAYVRTNHCHISGCVI